MTPLFAAPHEVMRWGAAALAALGLHATVAAVVAGVAEPFVSGDVVGAIVLELAPIQAGPEALPEDVAFGPHQDEAQASSASAGQAGGRPSPASAQSAKAEFDQKRATPPEAAAAGEASVPQPAAIPSAASAGAAAPHQASLPAPVTTVPIPMPRKASATAAPTLGHTKPIPKSVQTWKGHLVAHLERRKHYPATARLRREQGVAHLQFSIDRKGRLVASRLARSSGSEALDREALALCQRAQPFPPPPQNLRGERIELVLPIRFNVR